MEGRAWGSLEGVQRSEEVGLEFREWRERGKAEYIETG